MSHCCCGSTKCYLVSCIYQCTTDMEMRHFARAIRKGLLAAIYDRVLLQACRLQFICDGSGVRITARVFNCHTAHCAAAGPCERRGCCWMQCWQPAGRMSPSARSTCATSRSMMRCRRCKASGCICIAAHALSSYACCLAALCSCMSCFWFHKYSQCWTGIENRQTIAHV